MKKRILSVAIVMTMILSITMPIFAGNGDNTGDDIFGMSMYIKKDAEGIYKEGDIFTFDIQAFVGNTIYKKVAKREINITGPKDVAYFKYLNEGVWTDAKEFNVTEETYNIANPITFQLMFASTGVYKIEFKYTTLENVVAGSVVKYVAIDGETYKVTDTEPSGEDIPIFPLEVPKEKSMYSVIVDGIEVAEVEEGGTYTLGDATYGYLCAGNAYKASAEVTVNEEMEFTTINEITLKAAEGAGIRYEGSAGIRFMTTVNADIELLNSEALTTGMLITANDIYKLHNSVLTLEATADKNSYAAINVVNSGWFNDVPGQYCGSIVSIDDSNYIRNFIAVGYATITYTDGSSTTVYSNMTGIRSIKGVAQAVQNAGYAGIAEAYHTIIDKFAAAK